MFRWVWMFLIMAASVQAEDGVIPGPKWAVARAQFATAIHDREPVDNVVLLAPPVRQVYFFTDLRHLQERTVSHQWKFNGQVVSIVPFTVEGPRWRVYSKVELEPDQLGEWSVTVVDESGWPLITELFQYVVADTVGEPTAWKASPGVAPVVKEAAPVRPSSFLE